MAGKRGYTSWGYPIVWKRYARKRLEQEHGDDWLDLLDDEREALIHDACMERMEDESKANNSRGTVQPGKKKFRQAGKLNFTVTSDQHCIHLTVGNKTTYHSNLGEVAKAMKKLLVREQIDNKGQVTDIKTLIEIERSATKEILGVFDTLPKFEVREV